jgi:hypothetical protein
LPVPPEVQLNERAELAELAALRALADEGRPHLRQEVLCEVTVAGRRFPVQAYTLGNPDPDVPAVGFFGGVHGLERIGAEVVIAYLSSLIKRLSWDAVLHRELERVRLVFMPVVNPGGIWRGTRANPNGVDLMRNAPLDAGARVPFLVGGQRLSAVLPWYRGRRGAAMELENQAVCTLVERELLPHRFSLVVDCHSGFGVSDRIWFPHAHTAEPIAHLPELHALKAILDQTHLHHPYVFEPQSRQYLAHGDLWDYLYLGACAAGPERVFLPLTLEMGSWLWVKKNPRQLFNRHGIFNPLILHRQQRVLRRHLGWLDFVVRAAIGHERWMPQGRARDQHQREAMALWYQGRP